MRSHSSPAPDFASWIETAIELLDNGEVSPILPRDCCGRRRDRTQGPAWWAVHPGYYSMGGRCCDRVGGGSGVVPLISMIRQREATAAHVPAILLLSARRLNEVLYRDELVDLERRENGFGLVLTITREAPRGARPTTAVASTGRWWPRFWPVCPRRRNTSSSAVSKRCCQRPGGRTGSGSRRKAPAPTIRAERYGL